MKRRRRKNGFNNRKGGVKKSLLEIMPRKETVPKKGLKN